MLTKVLRLGLTIKIRRYIAGQIRTVRLLAGACLVAHRPTKPRRSRPYSLRAQKLERACLHLARPHAHSHPLYVGRRANWPQAIGEMSESGLEVPEDAAVHPRFELCGQHLTEATVDRGTRSLDVGKQERE